MPTSLDDEMKNQLAGLFAAKLLEAMDGPKKDALITKAIADALTGYDFRNAVQALVTDRAKALAKDVLGSGKYDKLIIEAIEKGCSQLIEKIPEAAEKALKRAFFGKKGNDSRYEDAGLILDSIK